MSGSMAEWMNWQMFDLLGPGIKKVSKRDLAAASVEFIV